ncbi:hypothetical protein M2321_003948 [Rhodoblastus acidophilus]|uniref:hypothetical protein n=1 Tax=Rhodoblastus acidophilus TaxID=1074 RepID=UPI0018B084CA|nr:hypothetical protein [Rhodoblastus acidophilus]MCW2276343.1 hypothetical protein [Rhodoblastus acidophilus]
MTETAEAAPPENDGWEWAIVEIFGHRKHAGRTREEERFGAKLLRIDIPKDGDPETNGWETVYYGGSSIFSFALADEATALRFNKPYAPPSRIQLTHEPANESDDDDDMNF